MASQKTPGDRLANAVALAASFHRGDVRKGTTIPYVSHLLQVAGLVLEYGGDEDEAIAGLLHDAAEDAGGETALARIASGFGDKVAGIVRENSDSITDAKAHKAPWRERKAAYLAAIPHKTEAACLVSIADKVHNARSLLADCRLVGDSHWSRFNAPGMSRFGTTARSPTRSLKPRTASPAWDAARQSWRRSSPTWKRKRPRRAEGLSALLGLGEVDAERRVLHVRQPRRGLDL